MNFYRDYYTVATINLETAMLLSTTIPRAGRGGNKLGKVGKFMKVEVHTSVYFNSDHYKWPQTK